MSFPVNQVRSPECSTEMRPHVSSDRKRIKVLIPYDGSENADVALNELRRAGLPKQFDAFVEVTHVWLPSSPYEITKAVSARRLRVLTAGVSSFVPALKDHEEQKVLSHEAERRIRSQFPAATVRIEALQGKVAVAKEIIRKVKDSGAELIIVGAKRSPSPAITDYADGALKIARESDCSVRIARLSERSEESPFRLMLIFDGPESSAQIVGRVADRVWPLESEAHFVLVRKPVPHDPSRNASNDTVFEQLAERLRATGLRVFASTAEGQPEQFILGKARELNVDCVFIHATGSPACEDGLSHMAQAVVLGAQCSVEVVRREAQEVKPVA